MHFILITLSIITPTLTMCTNCQAIIDTSSMLIIGPTTVINSFHNLIGAFLDPSGTGYYLVPCSQINTFPSLSLKLLKSSL